MAVLTVTKESFESVTNLPGVVFIDCWANWCPPCRGFKPVFEAASNANPDVTFASVNTEEEAALAASLGISSIPTILAFKDGVLVYNQAGALRAPDFDKLIDAVRAFNVPAMDS